MDADAIVIGAGIVGAACAYELAQNGLNVLVIDAAEGAATAAGMGHVVVMDDNPAELALSSASVALWAELVPRMDADCGYSHCGTLWIAADDEEMDAAREKQVRLRVAGVHSELLDAAALALAEPALRPGLRGALRVANDGVVYAPNAARWLLAHGRVPIRTERAHVTAIDGGVVHLQGGARRSAAAVVLAGGVQSTKLCPDLPLQPKKGHLAITDRYPGTVQHQLVELAYVKSAHLASGASVAFNVQPRPSGQLLIGSSRQFDSADPAVEPAMLARMLACALAYMPALDGLQITRSWAGFRAATPDGLPLIGAHPSRDKLWLAVGHEGLGVTTAPATARLLAAQLTGAACALDARPYQASRFLVAA